ncbi:MAG: peptide-methionine (S)-S-oxide reductase MsrA [Gemmatimonadota bacterium]|nr:peptide-methionine (S)-S-oxide reductase MsrA [Gemmatimonadota bacterium]
MADKEVATFGGGCFWCLEAVFVAVKGVDSVKSGYAGGYAENPTYEQVCAGSTGHTEVVQVAYDPAVVSYRQLLEIFFAIHDPTTPNRQGADVGTQYRSAIYAHTPEHLALATATIEDLNRHGPWDASIVTEVEPLETFYPAEPYHDDYFKLNPAQPYCRIVVEPKVKKFRQRFEHLIM